MPATLTDLVDVRSQLVEEALRYLDTLATDMVVLPTYYPAHLRTDETGATRFDAIRQLVQVVEDRSVFEQWLAAESERLRAAGQDVDNRRTYAPFRARPEHEDSDTMQRDRPAPPPPIPWDEHAGTRFTRAVILGDPGFGKTWLLRYEARHLAREGAQGLRARTLALNDHRHQLPQGCRRLVLPLFARLSDVNRSDDPLEDALVALAGTGYSDAFRSFMRAQLRTDCCVVLLDAWDEVPVEIPPAGQPVAYLPHHRQRLGRRLEAFARQCPQPRVLMTSRLVGYTASPIPGAQELELLAFDTRYIEAFARVWFADRATLAQQFLALLREQTQVRGLARIPLMLTLLCRVYQEAQRAFPTRRVDLYNHCLRGLLRDWKEEKEAREISNAYVDAVLELLQAVAYALFTEGYEQFSESLLRTKIEAWLDGVKHTHELYPRNPASLIAELKGNGVLITAGSHRDAPLLFLHRTFQEYLTACALGRQANTEGWESIAPLVDKKAWLPAWQEVIILLAGMLTDPTLGTRTDPTLLLRLLAKKQKDDYFRHRLALAGLCLPELPSDVQEAPSSVINDITTTSFSLWWQYQQKDTGAAVPHLTRMLLALAQVNGYMKGTPLPEWCCQRLHDTDWRVRESAVVALGRLGEAAVRHPDVLPVLLRALHDTDGRVYGSAAEALGRLGEAAACHPDVLPTLLRVLHDMDWDVRGRAAVALGQLGEAAARHPDVLPTLLWALHDTDKDVRRSAAEALGQLGEAAVCHPDVLPALLRALHDMDWDVRGRAAVALGRLGEAAVCHPDVLPALLHLALHDTDGYVRGDAAVALGQLGERGMRFFQVRRGKWVGRSVSELSQ